MIIDFIRPVLGFVSTLLLINLARCHEDVCSSGGLTRPVLTSALHGGWVVRYTFRPLNPLSATTTYRIGDWMGNRAVWTPYRISLSLPRIKSGRTDGGSTDWTTSALQISTVTRSKTASVTAGADVYGQRQATFPWYSSINSYHTWLMPLPWSWRELLLPTECRR
jgi:hypothetical protein